jgi:hypothetical protein
MRHQASVRAAHALYDCSPTATVKVAAGRPEPANHPHRGDDAGGVPQAGETCDLAWTTANFASYLFPSHASLAPLRVERGV